MSFGKSLSLAIVVALAASTFDILFHFFLGTEVHLGYVAVKVTVIFFTIFFVTRWAGVDYTRGLVGAAIAAIMFYIYYRFAEATLDRTVFKIDEDTLFILIHFVGIYLPYYLIRQFLPVGQTGLLVAHSKKKLIWCAIIGIILGAVFLFPTGEFLSNNNLLLGLSYNDHVLVGTLAFIIALAAIYGLLVKRENK